MTVSKSLILVATVFACFITADSALSADFKPPAKAKFKVFLLVGQSNMAGRGAVEEQDKKPHPRVMTLDKQGQWVPAVDPIHYDKPVAGVGLGTTFGKVIAEAHPDDVIGLVPCAFGGTSIAQWSPDKPDGLYADAIKRAKIALNDGTLAGILWHQGESDSKRTETYATSAEKLFAAFRKDLGSPDVPVVVGLIGEFHANNEAINGVLRDLPKTIPHLGVAESKGFEHKGDKVHFNAAAYREFGKRYAAQWNALATGGKKG